MKELIVIVGRLIVSKQGIKFKQRALEHLRQSHEKFIEVFLKRDDDIFVLYMF